MQPDDADFQCSEILFYLGLDFPFALLQQLGFISPPGLLRVRPLK